MVVRVDEEEGEGGSEGGRGQDEESMYQTVREHTLYYEKSQAGGVQRKERGQTGKGATPNSQQQVEKKHKEDDELAKGDPILSRT